MKTKFMISCAAAAVLSGWGVVAIAADPAVLPTSAADPAAASSSSVEEVVVTANRRTENIEKVSATIQALTGKDLSALNITTFDDALKILPNVTFNNNGPGQGNIFMRGMSTGSGGDQSSGTIGNFPNVAVYLDDQSVQFPGRNLDIYFVDMERVEVLEGPQGTLFGGGAEAGALRYITNKPKLNIYEGYAEGSYGLTDGGGPNNTVNLTVNIPLVQDKLAVRAVVYNERQGGYIDNVASTFTRSNADIGNHYLGVQATDGICPNKLPATSFGCTLANAPQANNDAIAGKDSNPTTFTGGRFSLLADFNEDWNVLITESVQDMEADGSASEYPTGSDFQPLQPLQNTTFVPGYDKDHYENTAWTVNGKLGDLKLIYTGSYLIRNINQQEDYTNYSRGPYGTYYQCTGGGTYHGTGPATCYSPISYWQDRVKNTHLSNEFRVSTPDTWRLRGIGGVYYEQYKIYDVMNWDYKTIPDCNTANLAVAVAGGAPCLADTSPNPAATLNDPGVRGNNVAFGEDDQRGYNQIAAFASADFDIIPHVLTVSAGTRYFDYSEYLVGSQYETGGGCLDVPDGQCVGETVNFNAEHDHKSYVGFKSKASITWNFSSNGLVYYLFSQGFRPGAFNRSTGLVGKGPDGIDQFNKPQGYAPDSLNNNEIGLKTQFFDHRLQVNLSAYYMNWNNTQFAFFNPTELGNTSFGVNGPNYVIKGVEFQLVGKVIEGLTIQTSGSYNDNTQANSPCLVDNNPKSAGFNSCITQIIPAGSTTVQPFVNPFGTVGSTPAFSPAFKGNIRGIYVWSMPGDYKATAILGGNYTGSMYNEPGTYPSGVGVVVPDTTLLRYLQPAYATADGSFSIAKDKWTATLYATNMFDSHASTYTSSAQFIKSEVPIRPRIVGVKIGAKF